MSELKHGGTGNYQNLGDSIAWMRIIRPRRILDVGCGFGRWGFLIREFLEIWDGRYLPREWTIHIKGLEPFSPNSGPLHQHFYDEIEKVTLERFIADSTDRFELAILGDVLEHIPKVEGLSLVAELLESCDYLLLILPIGHDWPQHELYANPWEKHLASWGLEDLAALSPLLSVEYHDEAHRPFVGSVLSRRDPKSVQQKLIRAVSKGLPVQMVPTAGSSTATLTCRSGRSDNPLHVVLVSPEFPPGPVGGIATYSQGMARLLTGGGHRVTILCWGDQTELREDGKLTVRTYEKPRPAPLHVEGLDWFRELSSWSNLVREALFDLRAQEGGIDIIEVTDYYLEGLADLQPLKGHTPVVTHFHGSRGLIKSLNRELPEPLIDAVETAVFTGAPYRKTYSPQMCTQVEKLWPGTRCQFIPAPFFPDEIGLAGPNQSTPVEFDLVFFGRLEARKGIETLAEAVEQLVREGSQAPRLLILGADTNTSPDGASMRDWLMTRLGSTLGHNLTLHPAVNRSDLGSWVARSRAVVIPSLWESLGFTSLEACCSGRPALISDRIGCRYVFEEDLQQEILFDGNSPSDLASKIAFWMQLSDGELSRLASREREAVKRAFQPGPTLQATLDYYHAVISDSSTADRDWNTPGIRHLRMGLGAAVNAVVRRLEDIAGWDQRRTLHIDQLLAWDKERARHINELLARIRELEGMPRRGPEGPS